MSVTWVGCTVEVTVFRLLWAAVALMTWLERVAIVPRVVMGVARVALALAKLPPAKLEETVPVTVPSVVTPVVPLTTSVVTVGLTPDTGDTRRTPPIGKVRRMVPG